MKYFVKIVSGIAMAMYRSDEKWSDDDHEITYEQFINVTLPCRVEIASGCVVFGSIVPWNEVPNMGIPSEPVEPIEPKPTQLDLIEAQVTYTAMMTDTLLEV
jgi:hypothetical protein